MWYEKAQQLIKGTVFSTAPLLLPTTMNHEPPTGLLVGQLPEGDQAEQRPRARIIEGTTVVLNVCRATTVPIDERRTGCGLRRWYWRASGANTLGIWRITAVDVRHQHAAFGLSAAAAVFLQ